MAEGPLNSERFLSRLKRLHAQWAKGERSFLGKYATDDRIKSILSKRQQLLTLARECYVALPRYQDEPERLQQSASNDAGNALHKIKTHALVSCLNCFDSQINCQFKSQHCSVHNPKTAALWSCVVDVCCFREYITRRFAFRRIGLQRPPLSPHSHHPYFQIPPF